MKSSELQQLAIDFTEAFNRDDLDAVMDTFADVDAIYCEFNGTLSRGKTEIRAALTPQFQGDFGIIRFHTEDLFADAEQGKVMIRWECVLERAGKQRTWRGLDLLHFDGGKLLEKHTYAKAEKPMTEKSRSSPAL